MSAPADSPIAVGQPHRTLSAVKVTVREYESGTDTIVLAEGSIFQPWEPLPHWRGDEVPITLGQGATEFDWGVTAFLGHFLDWDDFFTQCQPCEPQSDHSPAPCGQPPADLQLAADQPPPPPSVSAAEDRRP